MSNMQKGPTGYGNGSSMGGPPPGAMGGPPKGMGGPQGGMRGPRGFGGGPMGGMPMEKPKNIKGTMKKLTNYLKPFKLKLLIIFLFAALSSIFNIVGPKILAKATDELFNGIMEKFTLSGDGVDFSFIAKIMFLLILLYILSAGFAYIQGFLMSEISTKVSYNLRNSIIKKINKMPLSYFHRVSQGEVLSRITNDVDTLNQNLNQTVTQFITSSTSLVGAIVMMLTISVKLTLIAILMLPLTMILMVFVMKNSQKFFQGQQRFLGSVNGQIEEMYGGHQVVKAFNGENKAIQNFDVDNENLYNVAWKAQFLSGLIHPIMNFVSNLAYVFICIVGASLTSSGSITLGGIQAFIQYTRQFTQPIMQLANISNMFQQTLAASERVFEFLEEEEEVEKLVKHKMSNLNIKGDIKFENVRFGYENTNKIVIKDFSAEIKAGQKVAIVGPTGAGKTTLVKLLMRFHELKSGSIYIDGYNINEFSRQDLRSEFGMVLQDTWLYTDTIMENIRYGNKNAADSQVMSAARTAQVDHFIKSLPDGYNMQINEESTNISQGQKQLLTIARAVLSNSTVLILDEATSSVDTRTEVLIQKAMDNLTSGRTSFIIAHRLSTIRNADLILFLKDGDIVEQGTHDELLALNGHYAELYNSQFEKVS
jgi:ATP-binding cassette, subfamily B, multidrug efflux pump